jgi:flagellar protein FliO/FliZ
MLPTGVSSTSRDMPSFNDNFFASRSFTFLAAAIAFITAAILLSLIFRFITGSRLRLPRNGRARQPRLGVVDAFDLDRRRQLVIVRRDNVEHLLMIGGPNDLVIESEIIRAESRDARTVREAKFREKDLRERDLRESPPTPGASSWPYPAATSPLKEAAPVIPVEETTRNFAPTIPAQVPKSPVFPLAPRRAPPPVNPSDHQPAAHREPLQKRSSPPPMRESGTSFAKAIPGALAPSAFLRPALQRPRQEAPKPAPLNRSKAPPSDPLVRPSPDPMTTAPSPVTDAAAEPIVSMELESSVADPARESPSAAISTQAGSDDALEEEMARLLGRASQAKESIAG